MIKSESGRNLLLTVMDWSSFYLNMSSITGKEVLQIRHIYPSGSELFSGSESEAESELGLGSNHWVVPIIMFSKKLFTGNLLSRICSSVFAQYKNYNFCF